MVLLGRHFSLSSEAASGVRSGENGVFVGDVPLLERYGNETGPPRWRPRVLSELNRDLSRCYGLPVDFSLKLAGLAAAARALDRDDLLHAQIATLHLQIPDPPNLAKAAPTNDERIDLARQLQASGLLKAEWDPLKHPRWPSGSPDGVGGEFAPAGSIADASVIDESNVPVVSAQITIPAPFEIPAPGAIPLPYDILPPPLVTPNINPRRELRNPYPDRPECEQEWADALDYCWKLMMRKQLGRGDYRGSGRTFRQCVMGQVSEACGGNSTGA